MASPESNEAAIARLEERYDAINLHLTLIRDELSEMKQDVHEMATLVAEIKGGWKVAVIVAGIIGSVIGALAGWILPSKLS